MPEDHVDHPPPIASEDRDFQEPAIRTFLNLVARLMAREHVRSIRDKAGKWEHMEPTHEQ